MFRRHSAWRLWSHRRVFTATAAALNFSAVTGGSVIIVSVWLLHTPWFSTLEAWLFIVNSSTGVRHHSCQWSGEEGHQHRCGRRGYCLQFTTRSVQALHPEWEGSYILGKGQHSMVQQQTYDSFPKCSLAVHSRKAVCELGSSMRWIWLSQNKFFLQKLQFEPKIKDLQKYSPTKPLHYMVYMLQLTCYDSNSSD